MPWFQRLCRNAGLAVHAVTNPARKTETRRTVEEQRVNDKVVLRRTTIEEVEIQREPDAS